MSNLFRQSAACITAVLDHSGSEYKIPKIVQILKSKSAPTKFKLFTSAITGSIVPNVLAVAALAI